MLVLAVLFFISGILFSEIGLLVLLLIPVSAIIYSISTRLRPKLMTALGAIIALMPIALGIGTGAQLHQPLAIAVIGGFIIALPLLLVVLPSFIRMAYKTK